MTLSIIILSFNRDHPGDKAMYDTLESARHGDYGTAQLKWAGYLGKKILMGHLEKL